MSLFTAIAVLCLLCSAEASLNNDTTDGNIADISGTNETDALQTTTATIENTTLPETNEAAQCREGFMMLGDVGCIMLDMDEKRTWQEARGNCSEKGADLLVVPDAATHKLIKDLFHKGRGDGKENFRYWFGLNQQPEDSNLKWLDSSEKDPKFNRFHIGQKDKVSGTPACGLIVAWKMGKWHLVKCDDSHFSICMERSAIYNLLPSEAPTESPETTAVFANEQTTTPAVISSTQFNVEDDFETTVEPVNEIESEQESEDEPEEAPL